MTITTTNARPPKGPEQSKSPVDELRTLKNAIDDLQGKRVAALRLYSEEKAKRQYELNRAEELAAQLHALRQSMKFDQNQKLKSVSDTSSTNVKSALSVKRAVATGVSNEREMEKSNLCSQGNEKWCVVHTNVFTADVRQLGRLPPSTPSSLTWFSRSMGDAIPRPSDLCALLWPLDEVADEKGSAQNSCEENIAKSSSDSDEDVLCLKEKLKRAEKECSETHEELMESQRLIADLKQQLEETTRACKELIETIHEQEDTIDHFSS